MNKRRYIITALFAAALTCLGYAYFIEPQRLVVSEASIAIKDWPAEFDGFRIVMIGDVHGGSNGADEAKLRSVVEVANAQQPDIVVLLGDYVSEKGKAARPVSDDMLYMPMPLVADALGGLKAKYGVFAVLGNHDGWYGDSRVRTELERVGYRVLENEVIKIEDRGKQVRILGYKDHLALGMTWSKTSEITAKLLEGSGEGPVIALQHSPDIVPMITGDLLPTSDLKLILAAHTHGGQIWLPLLGRPVIPSTFGQKYADGHIKENGVDVFVTSGVGTSILPLRFMVPPEIAVVSIRSDGK